jgi:putative glutamine amidotransferase
MPAASPPRIAIPLPHSFEREYADRSIPQYEYAVKLAGGVPVRIPLDLTADEVKRMAEGCDGVLLPGSSADVDPAKFGASRSPHTAAADAARDRVDGLLLEAAYEKRKPILGICYGLQSLNVYHRGSLIQHIPDFLPEELRNLVNHEAGKKVAIAHRVQVETDSRLGTILGSNGKKLLLPVNSSHHQSADAVGEGLKIVGRCAEDGIIEALEGTDADHFVIAVQWHPERSVELDEASPALFRAMISAARTKQK